MFKLNSKLTMACSAAVLALAMAACSSSSDDNPPVATSTPPPVGDGGPDPVLTELEMAQAAAAAAATAAMTASGEAETAAMAAVAAVANLATMQTDATAGGLADEAQTAADNAMAAYMDAKAASEAANAADATVTSAVEEKVKAEAAQATAESAEMEASEKGTAAEEAATAELMIDGVEKSVGDTSLMADTGSYVNTTGAGETAQTVITGLLDKTGWPMAMGVGGIGAGVQGVDDNPDTAGDQTVKHVQRVAARTFPVGKTLDSPDDTSRLMLVTQYAGTKTANVYRHTGAAAEGGTTAGHIDLTPATDDDQAASLKPLKSEGMFYRAGIDTDTGQLESATEVGAMTKAAEVFSHDNQNGDARVYVVLTTFSTTAGTTTYSYTPVDITAAFTDDEGGTAGERKVSASIPEASDYKHIHFGAWAGLQAPDKAGNQKIGDLGIGFVQSIGDGLTGADMPNNGGAMYNGNWVATVRGADDDGDGDITLEHGAAELDANFTKATITANLMGLAKLEGAIDTNTFSGTKATVETGNPHSLASDGKFTGSFSGGFYGSKAAEAGGVFDFTSEDAADGEFRGAFGGDRKAE